MRRNPVIADGGIKYSGDIVKALAAGAIRSHDGHAYSRDVEESPGDDRNISGQTDSRSIEAWAPLAAMENGSKDRYFQEDAKKARSRGRRGKSTLQGTTLRRHSVPARGRSSEAGMGYSGAADNRADPSKRTRRFVKMSGARTLEESHPHDIFNHKGSSQLFGTMLTKEKIDALHEAIAQYKTAVISLSGGMDSIAMAAAVPRRNWVRKTSRRSPP